MINHVWWCRECVVLGILGSNNTAFNCSYATQTLRWWRCSWRIQQQPVRRATSHVKRYHRRSFDAALLGHESLKNCPMREANLGLTESYWDADGQDQDPIFVQSSASLMDQQLAVRNPPHDWTVPAETMASKAMSLTSARCWNMHCQWFLESIDVSSGYSDRLNDIHTLAN